MTENQKQWLLSLSAMSLLGPKCDLDGLTGKGYYKKKDASKGLLDQHLDLSKAPYKQYNRQVQDYLAIFEISDQASFDHRLEELMNGSSFSKDMDRLMQLGRTMDIDQRCQKRTLYVDGHPYSFGLFREVMTYEFHWPREGLGAYDTANAIMLLRLGKSLGYLTEERQEDYLSWLFMEADSVFGNYKKFGNDAVIARNVHLTHLKILGMKTESFEIPNVYAMAYYGIWDQENYKVFNDKSIKR